MGAVLIGGLIEGCLGLLARYWKKIITPIVAASVVTVSYTHLRAHET